MTTADTPDFDRIVDRRNTNSTKWDSKPPGHESNEFLPMWVADMDFRAPEPVICALRDIVERGVFGYSRPPEDLNDTYVRWVQTRQGVRVEEEWLLQSSGVLKSLALAIRAVTPPGAGIILQPPVYFPFPPIIEANGRYVVENPLIEKNREYSIDLDHLDRVAEQSEALLLCNPHNPVGRVFKREELQAVLEVCSRRRLLVISDEIHSDLIMPGHTHSPLYALSKEYDVPVVVLTSTTKTFNLAGLHMGWITVPDPETRARHQVRPLSGSCGTGRLRRVRLLARCSVALSRWQQGDTRERVGRHGYSSDPARRHLSRVAGLPEYRDGSGSVEGEDARGNGGLAQRRRDLRDRRSGLPANEPGHTAEQASRGVLAH